MTVHEDAPETCRRCRTPFDPADKRFDGAAQDVISGFCRGCVGVCHEATEFDHRCPVCTPSDQHAADESRDEWAAEGMATAGPFDDDMKDHDHD